MCYAIIFDDAWSTIGVHGCIIPRRHTGLLLIPTGRDVSVRALKNDQRFLIGREGLPLNIGARHVRAQDAVPAALWIDLEGQVGGDRRGVIQRDQNPEIVLRHEIEQHGLIIDLKMVGGVHVKSPLENSA